MTNFQKFQKLQLCTAPEGIFFNIRNKNETSHFKINSNENGNVEFNSIKKKCMLIN